MAWSSYSYRYPSSVYTRRRRVLGEFEFSRSLPYTPAPPQRALSKSSRLRLGDLNEMTALSRRREYAEVSSRQKPRLDVGRYAAISALKRPPLPAYESVSRTSSRELAKPAGADRRQFSFTAHPVTLYGTPARVGVAAIAVHSQMRDAFRFYKAMSVFPCVQRAVRREVMFALGAQGSHKTKRRRGPLSNIRC